ncbi:ParB/RepB/Spo0J family partition protein [Actinomycetaceae bacterium UMB8039B]|uniref:ParB/RepB/Spo0J family partition protein n=1 Tax=Pauljensenia sp. UMB8040A TaxID=3046343 RepID=UPI00254E978D|nr:ParB/RepB/Spo0J family partition protein [Pauljensenia sp. UMB8040A]MDK7780245.1 ParB/RepB/Spo0J family partition protein [Actinomycetaceae bacterium UMB8041B]MDK8293145.1 ParB/RepB/Spo0J family partition protein [Actinomycetaceae bacterium UMB8039B]MDK8608750.1 ParB/RepB/Spo0J family partition protein [Actinomycetaceae bacterium UMB8041A]MDK8752522.1 ParB/RepB/Spo0J family partition protein [Actinomycetaceae bacterium UMB8039A]MDK6830514.1 ParB/RepB/Spo0J family partition protein [Pauljens
MADKKSTTGGRHSALGKGLGALIPNQIDTQSTESSSPSVPSNPLDVFFPARPAGQAPSASRKRGGSAASLLNPKTTKSASKTTKKASSRTKKVETSTSVSPAESLEENVKMRSSATKARSTQSKSEPRSLSPIADAFDKHSAQESNQQLAQHDLSSDEANVSRETLDNLVPVPGATFAEIPHDLIVPNTRQPREVFDEDDLAELRDSIREVGVLQPIVVRPINFDAPMTERMQEFLAEKPNARFELIMGERRLRASELAGLEAVPAIIRQTEDSDLLRDALLENLHRAQLNPLEEASAYQQLMADFGTTQEELSKRIARSRPQIANTMRLLKLPPSVQSKVAAQTISAGHARALLALNSPEEMESLAQRIIAEGLSVRTTEELIRLGRVKAQTGPTRRREKIVSALGQAVISSLSDVYETRVTITEGVRKGKIVIEFAGEEDLQRIADLIAEQKR